MAEESGAAAPVAEPPVTPPAPAPEPKLFAGKYKSPEELERGYLELQSKLGASPPPPAPAAPATPDGAIPNPASAGMGGINDVLARAGVTPEQVGEQWISGNGQLTPETYTKLQQQGISRAMADDHLRGQMAIAQLTQTRLSTAKETAAQYVGGQAQYDTLMQWSSGNLTDTERADFNNRLGDPDKMLSAVHELNQRHSLATGGSNTNNIVPGGSTPPAGAGGQPMTADEAGEYIRGRLAGKKYDDATHARYAATPGSVIQSRVQ